ncbi:hypothetical protein Tco_0517284 [Tanacetum coccineum]
MVPFNIYEYASMGKCSVGLRCASISRESCHALPNNSCFDGVIWYCGPALVTSKDAGDAVTLLQLLELRNKHRPAVEVALEERTKGLNMWRYLQALTSKLYGFKENKSTNGGLSRMDSESSTAAAAPKCACSNVLVLKEVSHYCLGTRLICAVSVYFMLLMQDLMLPVVISYINAAIDTTAIGFKRRSPGCIFTLTSIAKWECSSYGRALALHARGTGHRYAVSSLMDTAYRMSKQINDAIKVTLFDVITMPTMLPGRFFVLFEVNPLLVLDFEESLHVVEVVGDTVAINSSEIVLYKTLNIVLQGLPPDVYALVNHYKAAKDIWIESSCSYKALNSYIKNVNYLQQLSSIHQTAHSSQPYLPTYEAPHHSQQYQHAYQPQISDPPPSAPQNAYHSPLISQQSPVEFPQIDSGLAVLVFLPGDDPIACLNKAMAFISTIVASCFPSTNNQLRTSSNPRNQATIQDGRTDDLDAYDFDCDDISSLKVVLMANLSSYDSDILSEYLQQTQNMIIQDTNSSTQQDAMILYVIEQMSNQVTNCYKTDLENKRVNKSLTAKLERYKERVKTFEQRFNVDLNSREKLIDSQIDDMIQDKNALKQEIDSLKQTLSKHVNEKESLLQTFTVFKKETKEKERKNMDKEIELEKTIKKLDNIAYKVALYDGSVISKKHDVIFVVDEEETLSLDELPLSNPKSKKLDIIQTPVEIEVSKELPKISLVKTSFQKLKNHLASFDKGVKVRTTPDAIIKGSWGFEHTKKVFKEEVIPFINSLQASFKDFENGLHSKLNEVKMVFNQMEAAVDQYVMNIIMHVDYVLTSVIHADNKCLVDANLESERLIQENDHLFELLLSQDIVHICVNSFATLTNYAKIEQHYIDEYSEDLMLKAELAKKEHMVEKKFFDKVVLRSRLDAKDVSIANLRKHIKSLKGKNVVEKDVRQNNPNVIAPRMFKLDLEPLAPKLLNNRDAHIDYIKHSREHADTLREIEVLVYVRDTCPCLTKPSEKLVSVTPLNKNKKVRFIEPATSSGMKSFTSSSRSQPSGNTKTN